MLRVERVLYKHGMGSGLKLALHKALADLGGCVPGTRQPLWDPILSFSHTFSPKSACVGGPHAPLTDARPPYGKSWIHHCKVCPIFR